MRHSSTAVRLTIVPLLAASFLAGCGEEEETAYCVDENDEVVENQYCDDDRTNGSYFWYFGAGNAIARGSRAKGGERVKASDRAALAQRGGFGSSSSKSGSGRSFSSSSGGGSRSGGG